jgi:hypothetical protein
LKAIAGAVVDVAGAAEIRAKVEVVACRDKTLAGLSGKRGTG